MTLETFIKKMSKKQRGSFSAWVRRKIFRAFGIFSGVMFWFVVVTFIFAILTSYDLLSGQYTQRSWWAAFKNITSDFLIGAIISFLFYFLVVSIPERAKRRIIRSNLKKVYADIKQDILRQVVFASRKGGREDLEADTETMNRLLTIKGFRAAFEGGREANEGFYAFANHISEDVPEYRSIIFNLRVLLKQIDFILHNYPIADEEVFSFFKRLEIFLMRLEQSGPGYDEGKVLSRFIWEIFAGWNWIEGDRGYDIIEKMIADI